MLQKQTFIPCSKVTCMKLQSICKLHQDGVKGLFVCFLKSLTSTISNSYLDNAITHVITSKFIQDQTADIVLGLIWSMCIILMVHAFVYMHHQNIKPTHFQRPNPCPTCPQIVRDIKKQLENLLGRMVCGSFQRSNTCCILQKPKQRSQWYMLTREETEKSLLK